MKKLYKRLLCLCSGCILIFIIFSGCAPGREISQIPYVQVLAVDIEKDSFVVMLYIFNPEKEETFLQTGTGASFPAAYGNATSAFIEQPHMGHLSAVFVGEKLFQSGKVKDITEQLAQIAGLRLQAALFVLAPMEILVEETSEENNGETEKETTATYKTDENESEANGVSNPSDIETFINAAKKYLKQCQTPPGGILTPFKTANGGCYALPVLQYTGEELTQNAYMVAYDNSYLGKITERLQELGVLLGDANAIYYTADFEGDAAAVYINNIKVKILTRKEHGQVICTVSVTGKIREALGSTIALQERREFFLLHIEMQLKQEMEEAIKTIYKGEEKDLLGFAYLGALYGGGVQNEIEVVVKLTF